jgi:hypothetical protein
VKNKKSKSFNIGAADPTDWEAVNGVSLDNLDEWERVEGPELTVAETLILLKKAGIKTEPIKIGNKVGYSYTLPDGVSLEDLVAKYG